MWSRVVLGDKLCPFAWPFNGKAWTQVFPSTSFSSWLWSKVKNMWPIEPGEAQPLLLPDRLRNTSGIGLTLGDQRQNERQKNKPSLHSVLLKTFNKSYKESNFLQDHFSAAGLQQVDCWTVFCSLGCKICLGGKKLFVHSGQLPILIPSQYHISPLGSVLYQTGLWDHCGRNN